MDKSINNLAMHLTNVAIQKTAANYDKETGILVYEPLSWDWSLIP